MASLYQKMSTWLVLFLVLYSQACKNQGAMIVPRVILPIMEDFHTWTDEVKTFTETTTEPFEEVEITELTRNPCKKHCRAEKIVDYHENRIPYRITEMVCRDPGFVCQKTGSKVGSYKLYNAQLRRCLEISTFNTLEYM